MFPQVLKDYRICTMCTPGLQSLYLCVRERVTEPWRGLCYSSLERLCIDPMEASWERGCFSLRNTCLMPDSRVQSQKPYQTQTPARNLLLSSFQALSSGCLSGHIRMKIQGHGLEALFSSALSRGVRTSKARRGWCEVARGLVTR